MSALIEDDDKGSADALAGFGAHLRQVREKQVAAVKAAEPALKRLVDVCAQRTGQSYKVRDLLYSLWNGQATSLLEIVALDWVIKEDVLMVLLAFGSEPKNAPAFFYNAVSAAFKARGLMEWFCEAHRPDTD